MRRAAIGMGGNLGDVAATFAQALALLNDDVGVRVLTASPLYRTAPWGGVVQEDFVNAAVRVATLHPPEALLALLLATERRLGRDRTQETRWGPRRIDLDLLLMEGVERDGPGLQLPHPRLAERAFVLVPLADVWPDAPLRGRGSVTALVETLDPAEVGRVRAGRLACALPLPAMMETTP